MDGGHSLPLSADELMAAARARAGIDIIDEAVLEPLSVLHRSLCDEAQLHEQGAISKQNRLLNLLVNRLRMLRDFADHPEIADEKIQGPLIIFGMGRSGTTKLQKTLSASGDFNWLPFWQAYNPASVTGEPHEPADERIREAEEFCRWFDQSSPEAKLGHPFEALEPEEDTVLTELSFVAPQFFAYGFVPSYINWLVKQPPTILFECLRDVLKYFQWQGLASSSKTWLLKSPTYFGLETEILKVFPDARFVMTHRTPLQTLPSICKLANCFTLPFSNAMMPPQFVSQSVAALMNQHLDNREAHRALNILDLHFDEINMSAEAEVRKVYDHIGEVLSVGALERMKNWSVDHPQYKNGRFEYSLEEFGFTADAITSDMSRYVQFIRERFGR